ncbi:lysophospholipid acyltransferase family protein [Pseudovibrio exalbescens]|nr:lysophospholipid acyltransferase family protein [Pseudovibrio exalbescens]MDD7909474.1 lysophospholipid acyltransferase family protein [Pseudovibrio exalbescens]
MILLRSILFNLLFYLSTLVLMIAFVPIFFLPWRWGFWILPIWCNVNLFLLRWIGGVKSEFRGLENLPEEGCIVASKHQSAWETFALLAHLKAPSFILKRELRRVPIFGWYITKLRQIPVDRGKGSAALVSMARAAEEAIEDERHIIIYPEGTRRPAGAEPKYKYGISHLYSALNCKVVPVAINSGVYWPRHRFFRFPGTITAEILPPIEPGLEQKEFLERLERDIETASDRLFEEAAAATPDNIIVKEARARMAARAEALETAE